MMTYRSFENDLKRIKEGNTDWGFLIAVIGGFIVCILAIVLFLKIILHL